MVVFQGEIAGRGLGTRHAGRQAILATVGIMALCLGIEAAEAQAIGGEQPVITAPKSTPAPQELINTPAGKPGETVETLAQADEAPTPANEGEITVTGTRIVRDGYSAPTPVSVISTEEIAREAPANISDFVNTLPAVRGSGTAANSSGALSNGGAGINTVNLRNLGANRTLVLVDGQRSVPSTNTGSVDVNTVPQALIQRVEVVTGGASSAYGSDAVSGVVNFILDKEFKGLKGAYEYGVTTYGDGANHKASLTGGMTFGEGRGHIIASGEYFHQKGIQSIDRDWNNSGFFQVDNPQYVAASCTDSSAATICYPQYLITKNAGASSFTPGGLVTFGALKGTYFGITDPATGKPTVNHLAFGAQQPGSQWMVGGDWRITDSSHVGSATLLPAETRYSAFGRLSYDFSPAIKVFAQFSYNRYNGQSYYQQTATTATSATTGVTIQRDNYYLPDSVRQAMVAAGLNSINIGTGNVFIDPQGSDNTREVFRYVAGASGQFEVGRMEWLWNGYYQRGETKTHELLTNAWNLARYNLAVDVVAAPTGNALGVAAGSPVCRSSLTNPTNGCVPLQVLGINTNQAAAVSYITLGGQNPLRNQRLTQDVASLSFSTNSLFELPAGPVSLAFGGEWRKEFITGTVPTQFLPNRDANNNVVASWLYGNYLPNTGSYTVKEAFVETVIPILKGMDFNGAARVTDYSTSGRVETWKLGLTYQVIPDIKLRGTISRDIRAPNLADLFAPGGGAANSVSRPNGASSVTDRLITSNIGNPNLTPEIAKTYGVGAVLTPRFLSGFAASVDYYKIDLSEAINSYGIQTIADQCYLQNIASSCNYIITDRGRGVVANNADIISIEVVPQNFVSVKTSGIDFEASYRRQIGPGKITLRALASYAIEQKTNNGVVAVTDAAGQNSGNLPDWTYRFTVGYNLDSGLSFEAIARGVSGGVYNNNYIVCDTNCPASTADYRTINLNKIKSAFYYDFNANYRFQAFSSKMEVFLSIRNLFNRDPVLVGNGPSGDNTEASPQTNRALYDVLGRVFRMGARFAF